jgi:hypothetical protein
LEQKAGSALVGLGEDYIAASSTSRHYLHDSYAVRSDFAIPRPKPGDIIARFSNLLQIIIVYLSFEYDLFFALSNECALMIYK